MLFTSLVSSSIVLGKSSTPALWRSRYVTPRAAAMGGAFTAIADDEGAFYYNPAGIGLKDKMRFQLINLVMAINPDTIKYTENLQAIIDASEKEGKTRQEREDLVKKIKELQNYEIGASLRAGEFAFAQVGNFGTAFHFDAEMFAYTPFTGNEMLSIKSIIHSDFRLGYAHNILENLRIGTTLSYQNKASLNSNIDLNKLTAENIEEELAEDIQVGSGIGIDVGALYTPDITMKPTFGLSILNLGGISYTESSYLRSTFEELGKNEKTGTVRKIEKPNNGFASFNIGFSITPLELPLGLSDLYVRGTLDFQDLNTPLPSERKIHFGFDGGFQNLFTMQMGMGDGMFSIGSEFTLKILGWTFLKLNYAYYGVERGLSMKEENSIKDRRHILGIQAIL